MVDKLNPNDDLAVIGSITSQDGRFTLIMQGDGNLVLYGPGGRYRWDTGTNGRTVSQAIMQGDGNFVMYGLGGVYIWDTGTNGHLGAYLIVQDDGNVVIYDPAGNPLWATNTNIITGRVAGFLPSTSGFHFANRFPHVPDLTFNLMGQPIAIGDAANGLCGGMVFAVRDFFEAGIAIPAIAPEPPGMTGPSSGPLFDYLVRRLFDSFNLLLPPSPPLPLPPFVNFITPTPPFGPGPVTYMWLMNPALPDHETVASNAGLSPRGRAWVMIKDEWPKIKADIDSGRLSPIGLIEIKSLDPTQMGNNHQVLVYGYDLDGTDLTMHLYDPNHEDDDTVTMFLSLADPQRTTSVTNSVVSMVWCFFRPDYTFSSPPTIAAPAVRIQFIDFNPPGRDVDSEHVVIQNATVAAVNMAQWTLRDVANHVFTFPSFTLQPGSSVTVWTKAGTNDADNLFWGRRAAVWNNMGDTAILRDNNGSEVDRYVY